VSTLSPENWKEISPYLDEALDLPEEERASWLEVLRASKPDLAHLLDKLLEEHRALSHERFLERAPAPNADESALRGRTVGPYTLTSLVGQGGMGSVWLAERSDGRFERRVAVKILNFAVTAHGGVERFKREGQILGQLAHPNIAELIDAGVTGRGEPYLVLEYVKGKQIDEYCDEHMLGVDARIQLFLDVLGAVSHAHANLIVHRDIKPSNVLVSGDGKAKLLDFGIAKLLADDTNLGTATLLTLESGGAMTPQFAAPEQLTGGAVTTATDVYSLGLLLYLLLTGNHPAGPGPHSPADLLKSVTETDAPLASQAVAASNDVASAERRGATPEKLRRRFRGDLDTILVKALKKKPAERYPSVAAFGDELRRYLMHEPIAARPDTLSYRLRKYTRRHRVGVAVATALVLLLAGFMLIQTMELRRITRERDRADRIADFMTSIFQVSDPSETVGNSVTARAVLDKASTDIETGLSKDPEVQARMMYTMGMAYLNLGLYSRAEALLGQSIRIAGSAGGREKRETLKSTQKLAWTLFNEGRFAEAESQQRKLLVVDQRVLGPEDHDTVGVKGDLATTLSEEGHLAEAEEMQREVLEQQKRARGPEAYFTLVSMNNLASILIHEGRFAEADKLEREAIEIKLRVDGPENLSTIHSMMTEAAIEADMGELDESEKSLRQLLELERRVLGPNQPEIALTVYELATVAAKRGRTEEALSLLRQAIDIGLRPAEAVEMGEDPGLKALHGDPRFAALVAKAKERAASQKSN